MKIKIFISYYSGDNKKMTALQNLINKTEQLEAVVIANSRKALVPLSKKVEDGILESQIIIPILTRESIKTQWINQEIGYATALKSIKILPIVEANIINDLKGFIHKQVDLSYNFQGHEENKRKESFSFKGCIIELINDIKKEYDITQFSENVENQPTPLKTTRFFKNGYFDIIKTPGLRSQINTTITPYMKNPSGILCIWGKVSQHHNGLNLSNRNLFILGTSSDPSTYIYRPKLAKFPNMWGIYRKMPSDENPNGSWCFSYNGEDDPRNTIMTKKILSSTWHLFSVEWSKQMNFIRFYIDLELIGEKEFKNWPEKYNSLHLGTWPNKNPESQFYSLLSNPLFIGQIDERILPEVFSHKPE